MQNCGECTLCCKLLEVNGSAIGPYCHQCEVGVGCKIYDSKPVECSTYQCMWLQMNNVGEELRPDKCGIIFDRISDDVICARIEKGIKLNELVMNQIKAFNREGFSILIFRDKDSKCFLKLGHSENYVRGIINDYSKLH